MQVVSLVILEISRQLGSGHVAATCSRDKIMCRSQKSTCGREAQLGLLAATKSKYVHTQEMSPRHASVSCCSETSPV